MDYPEEGNEYLRRGQRKSARRGDDHFLKRFDRAIEKAQIS